MAVFTYTARGNDGRNVTGTIASPNKKEATEDLKRRQLTVVNIAESQAARKLKKPHVKSKDIAVMTRQLATMIGAGIPLVESLDILAEQAIDRGFRQAMDLVIERVRSGSDFSTALAEHPRLFATVYVNMVKAGEASGQLDIILNRLADFLENIEELKREVKSAMTYPVISLTLILGITTFLIVGIVPKFKEIFTSLGLKKLPPPTAFLMGISDALNSMTGVYILVGVVSVAIAFRLWTTKTKPGIRFWHGFLLNMPIFGTLVRKVAISRFTRTFSTLVSSGVPIVTALEIVASTCGNVHIENAVIASRDAVSRGDSLAEPLERTRVFPPMVTRMIAIGERTGALEKLLSKISDFYDAEVRASVKALTSLIEPLLIGTMGFIVGGIVLAIFMPIIEIQKKLGGGG